MGTLNQKPFIISINGVPLNGNVNFVGSVTLDGLEATIGSGGSVAWGSVTGTLSSQTDLQSALDAKQATLVSATNIKTVNGSSLLGSGNLTVSVMVYPGAGIPLSTGSAWGTSITDNSANWNTAYGWGNHASAGYATATSSTAFSNKTGNISQWTNDSGYTIGGISQAQAFAFISLGVLV